MDSFCPACYPAGVDFLLKIVPESCSSGFNVVAVESKMRDCEILIIDPDQEFLCDVQKAVAGMGHR